MNRLLTTIDRTIERITEDAMTMTDKELYEGFTEGEIDGYKREARKSMTRNWCGNRNGE